MITKTKIEITGEITLEYDELSVEFQEALNDFKEVIDEDGDKNKMLKQVAFHVTRFGTESMVEGVGYVSENGKIKGQPFSGINVCQNYDEFDFEISR